MTSKYSEKLKDPRWQKRRLQFFAEDLYCLADGFRNLEKLHLTGVVADTYAMALSSTDIQRDLLDKFMAMLKARAEGLNAEPNNQR